MACQELPPRIVNLGNYSYQRAEMWYAMSWHLNCLMQEIMPYPTPPCSRTYNRTCQILLQHYIQRTFQISDVCSVHFMIRKICSGSNQLLSSHYSWTWFGLVLNMIINHVINHLGYFMILWYSHHNILHYDPIILHRSNHKKGYWTVHTIKTVLVVLLQTWASKIGMHS